MNGLFIDPHKNCQKKEKEEKQKNSYKYIRYREQME